MNKRAPPPSLYQATILQHQIGARQLPETHFLSTGCVNSNENVNPVL